MFFILKTVRNNYLEKFVRDKSAKTNKTFWNEVAISMASVFERQGKRKRDDVGKPEHSERWRSFCLGPVV